MRWILFGFVYLCLPGLANATVSISEVAWMGSAASANHEWIELHNSGSAIDVSGWSLEDGMNLSINLEGVIPSGAYVVLERTSEASASGGSFLIYTGALVNTGATLKLIRADGSIEDQVSGGDDWKNIGGDNTTKETAQYTNSGWVTAVATPGSGLVWSEADNVVEDSNNEDSSRDSSSSNKSISKSAKSKQTVVLTLPDVSLELDVVAQEVGYVNQPLSFSVVARGIGKTMINSLEYQWNFGDGETSNKKDTIHSFVYPGTYVVTIYANYKRQEQVARHEVTVLPVDISLTSNNNGDIQVNNDSPYEIDISNYRLRGDKSFEFPSRSVLLSKQTITIPKEKVGGANKWLVGLYDNEDLLLTSLGPLKFALSNSNFNQAKIDKKPIPQISSISTSEGSVSKEKLAFGFVSEDSVIADDKFEAPDLVEETPESDNLIYNSATKTTATVDEASDSKNKWTYLALIGLLLLGTAGVFLKPARNEVS